MTINRIETDYYKKSNVAPNITPSFTVIKGGATKSIKYNKDGSIKKTKCNKQTGISSEVFAFKTKDEIRSMYNIFDTNIIKAKNKEDKQIAVRNKLLFELGIHLGIRVSDLRTLRWSFFLNNDGSFKEYYTIQPKKQKNMENLLLCILMIR